MRSCCWWKTGSAHMVMMMMREERGSGSSVPISKHCREYYRSYGRTVLERDHVERGVAAVFCGGEGREVGGGRREEDGGSCIRGGERKRCWRSRWERIDIITTARAVGGIGSGQGGGGRQGAIHVANATLMSLDAERGKGGGGRGGVVWCSPLVGLEWDGAWMHSLLCCSFLPGSDPFRPFPD